MAKFNDWLEFVFERPTVGQAWYFDDYGEEFECSPAELLTFVQRTFAECADTLSRFDDDQVGLGLNYVFNNSCSNVVFVMKSDEIPFERRMEAIRAIKVLYRDCLAPRCAEALGHRNELGASSRLNHVCYMLWDISPIAYWEDRPGERHAYSVVSEVLTAALASPNIACVESALHGFGHLQTYAPEVVEEQIAAFLRNALSCDERLREYAKRAAAGEVQ